MKTKYILVIFFKLIMPCFIDHISIHICSMSCVLLRENSDASASTYSHKSGTG